MYHRIVEPNTLQFPVEPGMYVRRETFEMQMNYLQKNHEIVSLENYIENIELAKKNRLVALTFDDAWQDFYKNAYPILKDKNIPATVFIPTNFIETGNLFWSDKLAYCLSSKLKEEDRNAIHKVLSSYLEIEFKSTDSQEDILASIIPILKTLAIKVRDNLIKDLAEVAKIKFHKAIPTQFMDWSQIEEIRSQSLIKFDCHSHLHEISTVLTEDEFEADTTKAISILKEHGINEIKYFCYPNETRTQATDNILKKLGFSRSLGRLNSDEKCDDLKTFNLNRIGIHEDITNTSSLFALRLLGV